MSTNSLVSFMDAFSPVSTTMESLFFYGGEIELQFDPEKHVYYRVDDLGNLVELYGASTTCHIIDRSPRLVPWSAKMVVEKLLRIVPTVVDEDGTLWVRLPLTEFTRLALEAKTAPRDKLEDAGDIGHAAHRCLEWSIQHAIDHTTDKIVRELRDIPTDEKAKAAAEAAKLWMDVHNVRWICTERKVYSKKYEVCGTLDGLALVDACQDPLCCGEKFIDRLSLVDWKSSNHLHIEFLFQTAIYQQAENEERGTEVIDRWLLRLGKNAEEAGKFEPWHVPPEDFQEDLDGFLACLALSKLVDSVTARMSAQKRGVREAKKAAKAESKAIAKAAAKLEKAEARAKKRLEKAEEKQRIKEEKRLTKLSKNSTLQIGEGNGSDNSKEEAKQESD